MRKSCHQENRKMFEAYNLFQKGEHHDSIDIYESLFQRTSDPDLKANLACTISVISTGFGRFNYAREILESNFKLMQKTDPFVKVRYLSNLSFIHLVTSQFQECLTNIALIKQAIEKSENKSELIRFILTLFFRVQSLDQLMKCEQIPQKISLFESFYYLNLAFAKQICGFSGSIEILKKVYPIFISASKYQFSLICLRQLLLLPLTQQDSHKYQKQLSKVMSMNLLDQHEFDISESIQFCKVVAKEIIQISQLQSKQEIKLDINLWLMVVKYERKKLMLNNSITKDEQQCIIKSFDLMLNEKNTFVISEMSQNTFYTNCLIQIENVLNRMVKMLMSQVLELKRKVVKKFCLLYKTQVKCRSVSNRDNQQNMKSVKMIEEERKRRKSQTKVLKLSLTKDSNKIYYEEEGKNNKKMFKIVRFCECGSFLSKRNFNSDGGEYRFVKVTNSVIKWGKSPQKIEEGCQLYPLKDIRSISYGKLTPTLMKSSNHLLKQHFCFSLQLQKRTLDFYCKDDEETQNWVVGISQKLKAVNPKIKGYSIGKMLWKKMFMRIRQKYLKNLAKYERNYYYYSTAHAIILMGQQNQ